MQHSAYGLEIDRTGRESKSVTLVKRAWGWCGVCLRQLLKSIVECVESVLKENTHAKREIAAVRRVWRGLMFWFWKATRFKHLF